MYNYNSVNINTSCEIWHINKLCLSCTKIHIMDTKRVTKIHSQTTVDRETGEILEGELLTTSVVSREPDFIKLYVKDIGRLLNLTKSDTTVLFCILSIIKYDNIFYAVVNNKLKIAEETRMPMNTVNDSIRNLHNAGLLLRQGKGEYLVNPTMFAKGSWKDIVQIRMKIQYTNEGRTIEKIDITRGDVTVKEKI